MSRDAILARIQANKPQAITELKLDSIALTFDNPIETFATQLEAVGGAALKRVPSIAEVMAEVSEKYADAKTYSDFEKFGNTILAENPKDYEPLDFALIKGEFGVAENGAIWNVFESESKRSYPFLTQQLGIVIHGKDLVANMDQAYQRICQEELPPYGVFISGPSKTADIEQCLVKGAHGACDLTVYLICD